MLIGPSSSVAVSLFPLAGTYSDNTIPVESEFTRTADATAYRANEPKYLRWEFGVSWVPKVDAENVNSWWTSQASLLFWPDESLYPNSAYPVMFGNQTKPLAEWQEPYYEVYRKGDLSIETTSGITF